MTLLKNSVPVDADELILKFKQIWHLENGSVSAKKRVCSLNICLSRLRQSNQSEKLNKEASQELIDSLK